MSFHCASPWCDFLSQCGAGGGGPAGGAYVFAVAADSRPSLDLFVIGDDPLARGSLAAVLASHAEVSVVGHAAPAALSVTESDISAIVWDYAEGPAIELTHSAPLLALVQEPDAARDAMESGARGVLVRAEDPQRIVAAARAVSLGMLVLDEPLKSDLGRGLQEVREPSGPVLTPRELQVIELLAEGHSNRQLARRLSISERTVKFHVNRLLTKLEARTRTDAVVAAVRQGLIRL